MNKLWFVLNSFRFAKEKGLVSKRVVIALVAAAVLALAFIAWAGFAVLALLWRQAPALVDSGRELATETVRKVDESLPGLKEKVEQAAPGLSERTRQLWPGQVLPTQDVGGEDIAGVPRFSGLVRVAYVFEGGKRRVTYRSKADYAAVLAYYQRELAALGFEGTVLTATDQEESRQYRKANQRLHVEIRRHNQLANVVEVIIAEN